MTHIFVRRYSGCAHRFLPRFSHASQTLQSPEIFFQFTSDVYGSPRTDVSPYRKEIGISLRVRYTLMKVQCTGVTFWRSEVSK